MDKRRTVLSTHCATTTASVASKLSAEMLRLTDADHFNLASARFQRLIRVFPEVQARKRPSGEKAILGISLISSSNLQSNLPSLTRQTFMDPDPPRQRPAAQKRVPSFEKAPATGAQ